LIQGNFIIIRFLVFMVIIGVGHLKFDFILIIQYYFKND
jgi:hypothetical protein